MAFSAATVMKRASTILQDQGAVRWPAVELCDYLNDGTAAIAEMKPNACTISKQIDLALGTKQTLEETDTILADVVASVDASGDKRSVSLIGRSILDRQIPGWQQSSVLPFSQIVSHVIYDIKDPRTFYVAPGNTGDGKLDVVVGQVPAKIAYPSSALDIDAYTTVVPLPDIYQNALVNYVLYKAFSKDSGDPGAAQRATAHYELFSSAIGAYAASEAAIIAGRG